MFQKLNRDIKNIFKINFEIKTTMYEMTNTHWMGLIADQTIDIAEEKVSVFGRITQKYPR